jgi:phosphoribosyl 1,2-cyclic phosphodiesterase
VRVVNLASGSSGNALLIESGGDRVLVDCGIGPRILAQRLEAVGAPVSSLTATLLSHEHIDHVRGLPAVIKHGGPIYCTVGTARHAGIHYAGYQHVAAGVPFTAGGLTITPIAISHDAVEPTGFLVAGRDATVAVITDTGIAEQAHLVAMLAADLIVVEANYDDHMLRFGPYPAHLKRRVASNVGHLCNDDSAALLREVQRTSGKRPDVWLAHLSETNNRPEIAEQTVRAVLGSGRDALRVEAMARHGGQIWRPGASAPLDRHIQAGLPLGD